MRSARGGRRRGHSTWKEDSILELEFTAARIRETHDGLRFRVGKLKAVRKGNNQDLTHLLDRTYDYASQRELRWHLATRLGLPVTDITLTRH